MNESTNPVAQSYQRCRQSGDFVDTFYAIFTAKSPAISAKFKHTDFSRQKLMLRESLLEMLLFAQDMPDSHAEIERLGHRHKELDIPREMYDRWLDALCETIERHDPLFTPELGRQWRAAMQKGIEAMLSVY